MYPYINLGFAHVGTFGLMLWLAAVAATVVLYRNFIRNGSDADALNIVTLVVLSGIVGAKLWHELQNIPDLRAAWREILAPGMSHFTEIFFNFLHWFQAGFAWYGGLLFGISALLFQGWWARIGALRTLDLAAPAAAIGYGIGRIGCFLSGDGCYGIPTTLPWAMSFPNGIEPTLARVHPTPLYELLAGLIIGYFLWRRGAKPHGTGAIVGQYLILTGVARFLVEFVRRNPKILWGLSNAQLASAGSVLAGILLVWWAATRRVTDPGTAPIPVEKVA